MAHCNIITICLTLWASVLIAMAQNSDEMVIASQNLTNYGTWGPFENCSDGNLVTSFQLKVEPKHSVVDDTGLNGIRFFCGRPPSNNANNYADDANTVEAEPPVWQNLTSKVGHFGNWGRIFNCTTFATGFNLEAQEPQGKYKDDVGATNLKLICADGRDIEGFHDNGHVYNNTGYLGALSCKAGYGICGLQTQVEGYQAFGDDTSLNNLRIKCCPASGFIFPDVIGG